MSTGIMSKRLIQIALAVILLAAISVGIYYRDLFDIELLKQWIDESGFWAPLIFMLIYVCATVLFLPGAVVTLAGGAIFGPVLGVIVNLTGATIGAAFSFLIARYLASDWVSNRAEKGSGGIIDKLVRGVEAEGWRFVAFVRLVPLFPFNLLNYALGLTRIRFIEYFVATYIFMLPGAIAYTYIGYAGREALAGEEGVINTVLIALALFAAALFIPRLIVRVRRGVDVPISELKQLLVNNGTFLMDVRTQDDFEQKGHIDQAINIPLEDLNKRLSEVPTDDLISIICTTDRRSAKAASLLIKNGYKNVRVVEGGMTAWNKEL